MKPFSMKLLILLIICCLLSYCAVDKGVESLKWYQRSVRSQTVGDYFIPRDHADFDSVGNPDGIWVPWDGNNYGRVYLTSFGSKDSGENTVVENWEKSNLPKATLVNSVGGWNIYKLPDGLLSSSNDAISIYKTEKLNVLERCTSYSLERVLCCIY